MISFEQVFPRIPLVVKKLCNLHIYIAKKEVLNASPNERDYVNNVNLVNLFLSLHQEMKSCKNGVETANDGMGLLKIWHYLIGLLLEETVFFTAELTFHYTQEFAIVILWSLRMLLTCVFKSLITKSWKKHLR